MREISRIKTLLKQNNIYYRENVPFSSLVTFRIGGPVAVVAYPKSETEFVEILSMLRSNGIKPLVLGRGSNVLPPDNGWYGVIIKTDKMDRYYVAENSIFALSGVATNKLSAVALQNEISGFEDFYGIPGSAGGLAYNNGGAFSSSASDIFVRAVVYDFENGELLNYTKDDMRFSYRDTSLCHGDFFIVSVLFRGMSGEKSRIGQRMSEVMEKRKKTQPLEYPSAGSIFLRPSSGYAGKYIEMAGLKGFSVGDAEVSPKHAGFIVNKGAARASDVKDVISHVREEVEAQFGVRLECEIRIL